MVVGAPPVLNASDLPFSMSAERGKVRLGTLADIERAYITEVLERNNWNISRSAEELDIDRVTLYHKIDKFGLKKPA
jgi:transcriptional regulator of acetoin/glycerol metabolism